MGAGHSSVEQPDLERLALSAPVERGDALWARLETCEIAAPRKGTRDALEKAAAAWAARLYQNEASGNFRRLIAHMLHLLARCTSSDHARLQQRDVMGALNFVLLVRTAAKHHVEALSPHQIQHLYGEQMAGVVDGVALLLMADSREDPRDARQTQHTYLTYALRAESVLMLLVLSATQLAQPLDGDGVFDPFIDALMVRPEAEAQGLMAALLAHYADMAREPPAHKVSTGAYALSLLGFGSSLGLSSVVAQQPWQYVQEVAGRGGGGAAILSERCALLLLVLLNYRRASCNPYSEALNRMRDADRADHHAGGGGGPGSGGGGSGAAGGGSAGAGGCFPVSFTSLYEGIVASMVNSGVMACSGQGVQGGATGTVVLLYMAVHRNHSFLHFLLAKSEPQILLAPLLALLYAQATPATRGSGGGGGGSAGSMSDPVASASTYVLLVILLMLSQDGKYCANLHAPESAVASVHWFKDRVLTHLSIGSLLVIVVTRTLQSNLRHQDWYIVTNCLAVLCNMAPHMSGLHAFAAQRMVYLYEVLSKRAVALRNRLRPAHAQPPLLDLAAGESGDAAIAATDHASVNGGSNGGSAGGGSAGGTGPASADEAWQAPAGQTADILMQTREMLRVSRELRRNSLEMLHLALTHGLARNPHLVYAIIHKRHIFEKYSAHEIYGEQGGVGEEAAEGAGTGMSAEIQALNLILNVANFFAAHVEALFFLCVHSLFLTCALARSYAASGAPYSRADAAVCGDGGGQAGLNAGVAASDVVAAHQTQTPTHTPSKADFATGTPGTPGHAHTPAARASGTAHTQGSVGFCCVDKVVELIKEAAARATTALQMVHADALDSAVKYKYCEDDTSEQFFTPYLWSQVLVHSQMWSNMSWNSQRLRLFQLE